MLAPQNIKNHVLKKVDHVSRFTLARLCATLYSKQMKSHKLIFVHIKQVYLCACIKFK